MTFFLAATFHPAIMQNPNKPKRKIKHKIKHSDIMLKAGFVIDSDASNSTLISWFHADTGIRVNIHYSTEITVADLVTFTFSASARITRKKARVVFDDNFTTN